LRQNYWRGCNQEYGQKANCFAENHHDHPGWELSTQGFGNATLGANA